MRCITRAKLNFSGSIWKKVSVEAKDLVSKMLTKDPKLRPSCKEVLQHPWFEIQPEHFQINTRRYLDNMRAFEKDSKLAQTILTYIVSNMTSYEETKELEAAFKQMDQNKDGKLNEEELLDGKVQNKIQLLKLYILIRRKRS